MLHAFSSSNDSSWSSNNSASVVSMSYSSVRGSKSTATENTLGNKCNIHLSIHHTNRIPRLINSPLFSTIKAILLRQFLNPLNNSSDSH